MKAGSVPLRTSCLRACERSRFLSNPRPCIVFGLFNKARQARICVSILACFLTEAKDLFRRVQRICQGGRVQVNPCVKRARESVTAVTQAFFRNRPTLMIPLDRNHRRSFLEGIELQESGAWPRRRQRASSARQGRPLAGAIVCGPHPHRHPPPPSPSPFPFPSPPPPPAPPPAPPAGPLVG